MGYMHIDNLYKNKDILMFKECYALEKIHGTSAHIAWNDSGITFFSGGVKNELFTSLFDIGKLSKLLYDIFGEQSVTIYGEAYGGSCQKMSNVYGKELKFVAFDVKIGDCWLSVPQAADFVSKLDLDFVDYSKVSTDLESLDIERDKDSVQAIKNGMGNGHKREGIVLRPIKEFTMNNGNRVIAKHKRTEFIETKTPRIVDEAKLIVLENAKLIAEEWVTPMRLNHILDKIPNVDITQMRNIIICMIEDIKREGCEEIVWSKEVEKSIGSRTAMLMKLKLEQSLRSK